MSIENIAMFAVPVISLLGLWGANIISNRPKREDAIQKRIETIMVGLEKDIDRKIKQLEDCEARCSRSNEENRGYRAEIKRYKQMLRELQKGGDTE